MGEGISKKMFYHFKIHKENKGYWAQCLELEGCLTQGDSMEELRKNMNEALNFYLDEQAESNIIHPLAKKNARGKTIETVQVEPSIAFAVLLRHYRKEKKISQTQMARKLNMNNVYSYQRLEKKTDPKLSTITKVKEVFPDFPVECLFERC